jgi:aryl carrier-like protein
VVGCSSYEVPAGSLSGAVPIGRPIANARLYVLNRFDQPVIPGDTGELLIGGDGVARGYLGNPRLTAERFLPDPFSARPGERLYRSGDLARHRPSGELEFLGRSDGQIKIRGFRIELAEVETALQQHPAVADAVAVAREDAFGERLLLAYLVPRQPAPTVQELRAFLQKRLPGPMVPSMFVFLPALPLSPNGKVDRAALPAPGGERPDLEKAYVAPRDAVEQILAQVWAESLNLERIGIHDSFFALGGDSMRSVRIVARAKAKGLLFTVQDLFRHQTIAQLASHLELDEAFAAGSADEDLLARQLAELESLSDEEVLAKLQGDSKVEGDAR